MVNVIAASSSLKCISEPQHARFLPYKFTTLSILCKPTCSMPHYKVKMRSHCANSCLHFARVFQTQRTVSKVKLFLCFWCGCFKIQYCKFAMCCVFLAMPGETDCGGEFATFMAKSAGSGRSWVANRNLIFCRLFSNVLCLPSGMAACLFVSLPSFHVFLCQEVTSADFEKLCSAVLTWRDRSPCQRAFCLKVMGSLEHPGFPLSLSHLSMQLRSTKYIKYMCKYMEASQSGCQTVAFCMIVG